MDTAPCDGAVALAEGADLLVTESTSSACRFRPARTQAVVGNQAGRDDS